MKTLADGNTRVGSPPRGRGRRRPHPRRNVPAGLTPARAGTAAAGGGGCDTDGAHPRAGGDGVTDRTSRAPEPGSPPRGRGRRPEAAVAGRREGLTPARAGTADGERRRLYHHPGSPPRGRGRPAPVTALVEARGLTPARAGTARRRRRACRAQRAHPRAGGDGGAVVVTDLGFHGSPPRGRGRRVARVSLGRGRGLTPARAGTATSMTGWCRPAGAHPRAGGDGAGLVASRNTRVGSPPRGRGRRRVHLRLEIGDGLTPARAGTASTRRPGCRRRRAHPRAGGDGCWVCCADKMYPGSPPRGRGRPDSIYPAAATGGLTPARAGTAA